MEPLAHFSDRSGYGRQSARIVSLIVSRKWSLNAPDFVPHLRRRQSGRSVPSMRGVYREAPEAHGAETETRTMTDDQNARQWDYYVHLMDLQHTAPTPEEREAARREKLQIEIAGSKRRYAQAPGPARN